MKQCFKCGETLPLSEFYKHAEMADGHVNKCKECNKRDVRESYHARPAEARKAYERSRLHDPHRIASRKQYALKHRRPYEAGRRQRERFPKKYKARQALCNAVRDGKIQRLPCVRCGSLRAQGHHEDYAKPLDVIWLCPKHHGERHRELRDMGIEL